jgi:hypothetical protein
LSYPLDYEGSERRRRRPLSILQPSRSSPRRSNLTGLVLDGMSTLLRLASRIACLIVVVSFALFVLDQASSASTAQQNQVNEAGPVTAGRTPTPAKTTRQYKSGVREVIDEASSALTSPFKGVTSGMHNQWAIRGIGLVLALIVYGFGLGYLARMLRVRG